MKINRENWIFISGMADTGKTYWIIQHILHMPNNICYIYDFNRNDYQQFKNSQYVWDVDFASQGEIEDFMHLVYEKGNSFTVFEEADNYFMFPSDFLRQYVNTARNRGIGAIVSAKRAKSIKPVYRNRFTHIVLFRTLVPEDIEYMEQWAGTGKDSLQFVRNLEQGEHVVIDLIHGQISEVRKL